jgi:hypothetical protein
MTERAFEIGSQTRTWPRFTLREKRVKLVEEKLQTAVREARLLGIGPAQLWGILQRSYEAES